MRRADRLPDCILRVLLLLCLAGLPAGAAQGATEFAPEAVASWRPHGFKGFTEYAVTEKDGRIAVAGRCDGTASGLFLERPVDLTQTPILEWHWRVDAPSGHGAPETARSGDDFAARLYVVRDGGVLRWRTRAVNYVWSREQPRGADWPNPFAAQAHMVALRNAGDAGRWHVERRNVREDFRRFHGLTIDAIDAVAIMTDCDNAGGRAEAWYGTVRFLPER